MVPAILLACGTLALVIAFNMDGRPGRGEGLQVFLTVAGFLAAAMGFGGLVRTVAAEAGRAMARPPPPLAGDDAPDAFETAVPAEPLPRARPLPGVEPEDGAFRRINPPKMTEATDD